MKCLAMGSLGKQFLFGIQCRSGGSPGFVGSRFAGDANDDFIVEITSETRGGKDKRKARERIRTLRSHFRLRHVMTGCYLFSHKVKLPEWGFEQQEASRPST